MRNSIMPQTNGEIELTSISQGIFITAGLRCFQLTNFHYWFIALYILCKLPLCYEPLLKDDFFQRNIAIGSEQLQQHGLPYNEGNSSVGFVLENYFTFLSGRQDYYQRQLDYGVLPWWMDTNVALQFYRPVSSLTHWLDYQLWPDNSRLMHLHSLLWFALLLVLIFNLAKVLTGSYSLAALSLVIYAADISTISSQYWIASRNVTIVTVFGIGTLMLYLRYLETSNVFYGLSSLVFFLLTLFAGEIGLSFLVILFCYELLMVRGAWQKRLLRFTPFFFIAVAWLAWYAHAGYGAKNMGFYINPVKEFATFVQQVMVGVPLKFFAMLAMIDGVELALFPAGHRLLALFAIMLFCGFCYLLWPLLKTSRRMQFYLLSFLGMAIPMCAVDITQTRHMALLALPAALLFAEFIRDYYTAKQSISRRPLSKPPLSKQFGSGQLQSINIHKDDDSVLSLSTGRTVLYYFLLIFHIGFSLLFQLGSGPAYAFSPSFNRSAVSTAILGLSAEDRQQMAGKHLILLSCVSMDTMALFTYVMDYQGETIPSTMRNLLPWLNDVEVERIDQQTLKFKAIGAGTLLSIDNQKNLTGPYGFYSTSRMVRADTPIEKLDYSFDEMDIHLVKMHEGLPTEMIVTLKYPAESDQYVWLQMDAKRKKLTHFELPAVGDKMTLLGPPRNLAQFIEFIK